jgi:alpha-tubulin suppressor-like RCC1 family protein
MVGDGTTNHRSSPVSVLGNFSFRQLAGASNSRFGLDISSRVWSWGRNEFGQLGDNSTNYKSSPVSVVGNHLFMAIAGNSRNGHGLKVDGTIWSWGKGALYGYNGDNTIINRSSPVSVVGNHSFIIVGPSCGLKADGSAWCWGRNSGGISSVGDNTGTDRSSPVSTVGAHSFIQIVGNYTLHLARKADGTVWGWGYNGVGMLGDNTISARASPVSLVGNHLFVKIVNGSRLGAGLKVDGTVWTWGHNGYGGIGDNTTNNRSSPVSVIGNHSFNNITAFTGGIHATKNDGSSWAWGSSAYGQVGDNAAANRSSPVSIVGMHTFARLQEPNDTGTSAALKINNLNTASKEMIVQAGHGFVAGNVIRRATAGISYQTAQANSDANAEAIGIIESVLNADTFVVVYGGRISGLSGFTDGVAYFLSEITAGVLTATEPAPPNVSKPIFIATGTTTGIVINYRGMTVTSGPTGPTGPAGPSGSGSGAVSQGQTYLWGSNATGQLGQVTDVNNRSSPVSFVNNFTFPLFAQGGAHALGIRFDSTPWAWGRNQYGQIGDNTTTNRSSPVSTVGNFSFEFVKANEFTSAALQNLRAWTWGRNTNGQLGDNSVTHRSSPISVVGAHQFQEITIGIQHTLALKADFKTWSWGRNNYGQLGDNTTTNRSSPVLLIEAGFYASRHSFVQINAGKFFSVGLNQNGTAWTWGHNTYGKLGTNNVVNRSSPVSVIGAHSFVQMSAFGESTVALKSDGSVWAWGRNNYGQIGDNSASNRSSPVSVVGGHSFMKVIAGYDHNIGIKADGRTWAWGNGASGGIGDSGVTSRSSPVLVVGDTLYRDLTAGSNVSLAQTLDPSDEPVGEWELIQRQVLFADRNNATVSAFDFTKLPIEYDNFKLEINCTDNANGAVPSVNCFVNGVLQSTAEWATAFSQNGVAGTGTNGLTSGVFENKNIVNGQIYFWNWRKGGESNHSLQTKNKISYHIGDGTRVVVGTGRFGVTTPALTPDGIRFSTNGFFIPGSEIILYGMKKPRLYLPTS